MLYLDNQSVMNLQHGSFEVFLNTVRDWIAYFDILSIRSIFMMPNQCNI